jgi:hypothetical protein
MLPPSSDGERQLQSEKCRDRIWAFGIFLGRITDSFLGIGAISKRKGAADDLSISDTECVSAKVSNVLLETVSIFHHRQT